jgi:3-hydroxyacyl-[acyl-carrier-protein] dehydratase
LKTEENTSKEDSVYYFVGIDGVRFKKPVTAGDQLILKATIDRQIKGVWKYSVRAEVNDQLVTEAKLMCTARSV